MPSHFPRPLSLTFPFGTIPPPSTHNTCLCFQEPLHLGGTLHLSNLAQWVALKVSCVTLRKCEV